MLRSLPRSNWDDSFIVPSRFLMAGYNNDELARTAEDLFDQHEDTREQRIREAWQRSMSEDMQRELTATHEARKIYERSLSEAS